ncbi:MAG: hypothetical protein Ct9H90mP20_3480 [Candidatus Neomarinimicrobiota bacterium]|nr:MAG: hypothetical protein Ct9H90mP20_3480 [Candidatus Neomarinimicrobiota bacterium]
MLPVAEIITIIEIIAAPKLPNRIDAVSEATILLF